MSYIDQSDYKSLLNKFAEGTQKQKLQENYVDLKPIGTFEGAITSLASAYKEYDGMRSMEEADLSPKQKKIAAAAPPEDKITGADFAAMKKDKKDEGLYGDGPMLAGPTGYQLENLTLEERKELKSYAQSMKTTRKAIEELLEKAKMRMEGGNTTGKNLNLGADQPTQTPTEEPIQENEGTDSNEYISSIENNKPIFIYKVNDKGHKEPVPVTKDMLVSIERDYRENFPGSPSEFARERDMPVEYIGKILTAGRYFNPDYKQKSATPGGRHRANFDNMGTKPHQGPNVGKKGFDY